jgi:octaprenyl-diphosphate synthase
MHLGTSFQLVDDVLDYTGDRAEFGKNLGADLIEGKMTLPLIRAAATGTKVEADLIRAAITDSGADDFTPVMDVLERTGALDYARARAVEESEAGAASLQALPSSPFKENLLELAAFAARRTY